MKEEDVLIDDQLVFLGRKRKTGDREFHEVARGETLYDICQEEGIRMESLVEFNHLQGQPMAAPGEKLYLQSKAPSRPRLVSDVTDISSQKAMGITNNISNSSLTRHVVQGKETLVSIARKYGISVEKLREWNNLNNNEVKMGQELVVYKN
jgi:LysM repeat protein